jgi:hypothetical protein
MSVLRGTGKTTDDLAVRLLLEGHLRRRSPGCFITQVNPTRSRRPYPDHMWHMGWRNLA